MGKTLLRIGCRDSELAKARARKVMNCISAYSRDIELELVLVKTAGDRLQEKRLNEIPAKGLFTRELEDKLSSGEVDLCVHNLQDVPIFEDPKLPLVAVGRREDVRDALLLQKGMEKLPPGGVIGCRGAHRRCQLGALYPHGILKVVRGNTLARVERLDSGEVDALLIPMADILLLGLQDRIGGYFQVAEMLPAPCQGAIAVQSRKGENVPYLESFHHAETYDAVFAERCFVKALGENSGRPFAAYAEVTGDTLQMQGMLAGEDGKIYKGIGKGARRLAMQIGVELAVRLQWQSTLQKERP